MRKPIYPNKPYPPIAPQKTLSSYKYIELFLDESLPIDNSIKYITLTDIRDAGYIELKIATGTENNLNYDKEYTEYLIKMKKYNQKLVEYEANKQKYNKDMKDYQKFLKLEKKKKELELLSKLKAKYE